MVTKSHLEAMTVWSRCTLAPVSQVLRLMAFGPGYQDFGSDDTGAIVETPGVLLLVL